jgi:hypothetical protein
MYHEFTSTKTGDEIEASEDNRVTVTLPWRKRNAARGVECGDDVGLTSSDGAVFIGEVIDVDTYEDGFDQEIWIELH